MLKSFQLNACICSWGSRSIEQIREESLEGNIRHRLKFHRTSNFFIIHFSLSQIHFYLTPRFSFHHCLFFLFFFAILFRRRAHEEKWKEIKKAAREKSSRKNPFENKKWEIKEWWNEKRLRKINWRFLIDLTRSINSRVRSFAILLFVHERKKKRGRKSLICFWWLLSEFYSLVDE